MVGNFEAFQEPTCIKTEFSKLIRLISDKSWFASPKPSTLHSCYVNSADTLRAAWA